MTSLSPIWNSVLCHRGHLELVFMCTKYQVCNYSGFWVTRGGKQPPPAICQKKPNLFRVNSIVCTNCCFQTSRYRWLFLSSQWLHCGPSDPDDIMQQTWNSHHTVIFESNRMKLKLFSPGFQTSHSRYQIIKPNASQNNIFKSRKFKKKNFILNKT